MISIESCSMRVQIVHVECQLCVQLELIMLMYYTMELKEKFEF